MMGDGHRSIITANATGWLLPKDARQMMMRKPFMSARHAAMPGGRRHAISYHFRHSIARHLRSEGF